MSYASVDTGQLLLLFAFVLNQGRNKQRANRAIAPPRNFCKHDGIHVLHMKSYFSRLRHLYVNFSRQLFRIRAASYWIKLLNQSMHPASENSQNRTGDKF